MNNSFQVLPLYICYCRCLHFCQKNLVNMHKECNQLALTSSNSSKQIKKCSMFLLSSQTFPLSWNSGFLKKKKTNKKVVFSPITSRDNLKGKARHLLCQRSRKYFLNCITAERKPSLSCMVYEKGGYTWHYFSHL